MIFAGRPDLRSLAIVKLHSRAVARYRVSGCLLGQGDAEGPRHFLRLFREAEPDQIPPVPDDLRTQLSQPCRVESGCHAQDRKSTRLNSSHLGISYAVFCLKKKK